MMLRKCECGSDPLNLRGSLRGLGEGGGSGPGDPGGDASGPNDFGTPLTGPGITECGYVQRYVDAGDGMTTILEWECPPAPPAAPPAPSYVTAPVYAPTTPSAVKADPAPAIALAPVKAPAPAPAPAPVAPVAPSVTPTTAKTASVTNLPGAPAVALPPADGGGYDLLAPALPADAPAAVGAGASLARLALLAAGLFIASQ